MTQRVMSVLAPVPQFEQIGSGLLQDMLQNIKVKDLVVVSV